MPQQLNILWRKEPTPNTDLYVDIFAVQDDPINFESHEKLVNLAYQNIKIPQYRSNKVLAAFARHQGKEKLMQRNFMDALKKFNFCLALAMKGTTDAGIAYADRSESFFHLRMFEECLVDIEMAKKTYHRKRKLMKLNKRADACHSFINNATFKSSLFSAREPKLGFNEHMKFAGVANCLMIQKNEKFGRHIISTCDLNVGQTILVEKPFSIAPKGESKGRSRCDGCFKDCMNFITCDNCSEALFCNENCMEESFHRYECNRPSYLSQKATFGLVLRMFYKINANFEDVKALMVAVDMLVRNQKVPGLNSTTQKEFSLIFQLTHNHEKQSEDQLKRLRTATAVALTTIMRNPAWKRKFALPNHGRFLQHLILHLFHVAENAIVLLEHHQNSCNDPMDKYSLEEYAIAMYPFACYMNHSCVPNVCCFFIDDRFICKVIRPIKRGEQVLRSYMYVLLRTICILSYCFIDYFFDVFS